ncbi:MAG: YceI family protein [Myxococcaceae bacterium]
MRTALAALVVCAFPFSAHASDWVFDPAHTSAQFAVKHMMVSTVRGAFSGVSGSVHLDDGDVTKSSVMAVIPIDTVDTREPKRDGHLKSADFFDAAKFPTMTFKSTKVSPGQGGKLSIEGVLTLHGVSKPVVLEAEITPEVKGMGGHVSRGVSATTKVNRKDFGLVWNKPLETGGVLIGDEVSIQIDAELNPKP